MSAMESVGQLIDLIRENNDIANYADGCDPAMIAAAESQLGVQFPPSYRRFIAELGTCDVAGEEFLGVYRTEASGQQLLGSVSETLDARARAGLPPNLVVIMFDGMGGLIVLDVAERDSAGESPVFAWHPAPLDDAHMERLGDDFGSFALASCTRAVSDWRESS